MVEKKDVEGCVQNAFGSNRKRRLVQSTLTNTSDALKGLKNPLFHRHVLNKASPLLICDSGYIRALETH